MNRYLFTVIVAVLFALPVAGQQHPNEAKGFSPDKTYDSFGPDTINTFNGNLTISIPIGQQYTVGKTLSYGFNLVYNAHPWEVIKRDPYVQVIPGRSSNAGLGWMLSLGDLIPAYDPRSTSNQIVYESPDGAQHVFYPNLHDADTPRFAVQYTRDGSYLRIKGIYDSNGNQTAYEIEFPNGNIHRFEFYGALTQMRDPFGNWVNISTSGPFTNVSTDGSWTSVKTVSIQDQSGRQHTISYKAASPSGNWVVTSVDLAGFNGSRAVYTFNNIFNAITMRGCGDTDPTTGDSLYVAILSSITLPDGSIYHLGPYYDGWSLGTTTDCTMGLIHQLQVPTKGYIQWDYQPWLFPALDIDAGGPRYSVPGVSKRRLLTPGLVPEGEWTYTTSLTAPPSYCYPVRCYPRELVNNLTTPQGDKVTHYYSVMVPVDPGNGNSNYNPEGWSPFEYGMPFTRSTVRDQSSSGRFLSAEIYAGTSNLKHRSYARFEHDTNTYSYVNSYYDTNRRLASESTIFLDDGLRHADTDFTLFDGLGHYRDVTTNGNFDGGNVHETFVNYNPSVGNYTVDANGTLLSQYYMLSPSTPWNLNIYTDDRVTENGSSVVHQYCFSGTTGFLTRVRAVASTALSPVQGYTDTMHVYTPDAQGNTVSEQAYGGDAQTLFTGDVCTSAFGGSAALHINYSYQYNILSAAQYYDETTSSLLPFKNVDRTIDPNTGLPMSSRDSAGLQTTYQYDALGRLTFAVPDRDVNRGSIIQYVYTTADSSSNGLTTVDVKSWDNSQTTLLAHSRQDYDEFGRVFYERRKLPSSSAVPDSTWSTRKHTYYVMGWPLAISEWATAYDPPYSTSFSGYDPFGRAATRTNADGRQTTFSYIGVRTMTRGSCVRTDLNSAGQAPCAVNESLATTTEVYDRQGRLFSVSEPSGANGTVVTTTYGHDAAGHLTSASTPATEATQTRTFTYDGRGFLTSEWHPEKGASNATGGAVTYRYDGAGHTIQRIDGSRNISFVYDGAGRLSTVTNAARGLVLKNFTYAGYNNYQDWRAGKLITAVRHNYDQSENDTVVTENYSYAGKDGRISRRDTSLSTGIGFWQTFAYDDLGHVTSMQYPSCSSGCTWGGPAISYQYANGWLTGIPNWAPSITYGGNGVVNQVSFATGTWTQTPDPYGMQRPGSISGSGWQSGTYQYDGSGNISAIGVNYALYDRVGRVTQSSSGGAANYQQYTYDSFGNMMSEMTYRNNAFSGGTYFGGDSSRNRSGFTYDDSGNVVTDHFFYSYDALGMQTTLNDLNFNNASFVYTADDERIWSYDANRGSFWRIRDLTGNTLAEFFSPDNNPQTVQSVKDYVYRDGILVGSSNGGASPAEFYHVDHLGTPRVITSAFGGGVMSTHDYFAFGEPVTSTCDGETLGFNAKERDADTPCSGYMLNFHAREYGRLIGRFLSVDPGRWNPKRPQSFNRYSYVVNDPVRYVDPDGQEALDPTIRTFLQNWYSADFSKVQVYGGFLAQLLANRNLAITFGNRIFFSGEGWARYKSVHDPAAIPFRANLGVSLTGHEVTHTLQARPMGVFSFVLSYLHQWASAGFDYNKIPYEIEAGANEKAILNYLFQNPDVLDSIRNGSYSAVTYQPNTSGWADITSLSNGPYGGLSALYDFNGVLYIDGVELTGVFSAPRK